MRIKIIIAVVSIITVFGFYLYSYFEGNLDAKLSYSYNEENNLFSGVATFQIFGLKEPADVEVIVISPNNTVEYLSVKKKGKKYVSEKYEAIIEKETLYEVRPEFLITWRIDGRKNIEYIYRGNDIPFFPINPE